MRIGYGILFISIFIATFFFLNINTSMADFPANWNKCRIINITGSHVANYSHLIRFNTNNVSYSEFEGEGIFRIYNGTDCDNPGEEYDYWVERWDEAGDSVFWFQGRYPDEISVLWYYNSSGQANASNITTTFIFGDDFIRADNATVGNGWDEFDELGGEMKIFNNTLVMNDTSATQNLHLEHVIGGNANNSAWMWRMKDSDASESIFAELNDDVAGGSPARIARVQINADLWQYMGVGNINFNGPPQDDNFYVVWMGIDNPNKDEDVYINYTSADGVKWVNDGNLATDVANDPETVEYYTGTGGLNYFITIDWVAVRLYNDPDPTYLIGAEETEPAVGAGLEVFLNYPADDSTNTTNIINFSARYVDTDVSNCSLWINGSLESYNTSAVLNNTNFTIEHTFSSDGHYDWTIGCHNTTDLVLATNRTIIILTIPTTPTLITLNGTDATQNETFYKDNVNITINCSGSTDPIGGDITNYIGALHNATVQSLGNFTTVYTGINWTISGENAGGTWHPDGKLYRYGGNSLGTRFDNISVYNISDKSVTELPYFLPTTITEISYSSVVYNPVDKCDYIYGGRHGANVNKSIVQHCPADQTVEVLSEELPTVLRETCVVFYEPWNSSIGCGGGHALATNVTDECFIHNYTDGTVTNMSVVLPDERYKGGCYITDDEYYYIGGRDGPTGGTNTIFKINLTSLTATTEGYTLPSNLEITCRYDDFLEVGFCFGGIQAQSPTTYFDYILEMNHTAGTVTDIGDTPDAQDDFTVQCNSTLHTCYLFTMQAPGSPDNDETKQHMIYVFNYSLGPASGGDWVDVCSHLNGSTCNWNISDVPPQTDIDFRCRSSDLGGSGINSSYLTAGANVSIAETSPSPPINITINSPQNITYTFINIDLNWTANREVESVLYSLNGGENISLIDVITNVSTKISSNTYSGFTMAMDGSSVWVGNNTNIAKLNIDGTFDNVIINTANCQPSICGVHINSTNVFVFNKSGVFLHDKSGNFLSTFTTNLTGLALTNGPHIITGNSTRIWLIDSLTAAKEFDTSGNFVKLHTFGSASPRTDACITGDTLWTNVQSATSIISSTDLNTDNKEGFDLPDEIGANGFGISCNSTDIFAGRYFSNNVYKIIFVEDNIINTTITATQGPNNVTVWANTTNPSEDSETVFFFVDSIVPTINIVIPDNETFCNVDTVLNFTYVETNPDSCWYSLNGAANVTLASCDTNGTSLVGSSGGNNVRLCINDTAGSEGCDQVYYTKDTLPPVITIVQPPNGTIGAGNIPFEVTFDEIADFALYRIDSGTNVTNDSPGTSWSTDISPQSVGPHNITVWANDTCGFQNETTQFFTVVVGTVPEPDSVNYNQFLYNFSNPNVNENATTCFFIFNDLDPANYTCGIFNVTINANIGQNNLTLCWLNASGEFCNETMFNVSIRCLASEENDTICSGKNFAYIVTCRQFTATTYQFDYTNMTFCESGCVDGTCINRTTCLDNCKSGETMCNSDNVISCKQKSDGCFDWSSDNRVFCNKGCQDGQCLDCQDLCPLGSATCDNGKTIQFCQDDNGDGCLEWSNVNTTECEFGCFEDLNTTTGINNVSCNVHSFDDIYLGQQALQFGGWWFNYVFNTLNLRVWITLIMMVGFGGIAALAAKKREVEGSWKIGLMVMSGIIFLSSSVGFMPWTVTIIFLIFVAGVWFSDKRKSE